MIKVMHVITTLGPAGAETMLCRVASGMDSTRFENEIVSLTGILGPMDPRLQARPHSDLDVPRELRRRFRSAPGWKCPGRLGHSRQRI